MSIQPSESLEMDGDDLRFWAEGLKEMAEEEDE